MAEIIHALGSLDRQLFLILNAFHTQALDDIMVGISNKWVWIPFYAFLFYLVIKKYRVKSFYIVISVIILIVLSDQISVQLFKNVVQRLRPCHDERIASMVHIVNNHCGGMYGFVSSHAANVFALAVLFGKLFETKSRWWTCSLLMWATIVSYSRIYLGVHYPLDIICGAMVGAALAWLIYKLLFWADAKFALKIQST